ncbi:sugar phosphate isomerase/epimerase [Ruania suaedae]|uniref:sugar phosphate isomerase/epimerase family protein n=1 Tax=Ruania suaedae TaxID=2897774 RepID=UPI001E5BF55A|nr:sugar phosphate isomerase/epimerase [Ruania suaedae]UFU02705.1 sugar phosphate isomerase/epimerase [Ruania suaedae]
MRLGMGSYAFRWQLGINSADPAPLSALEAVLEETATLGCEVLQLADIEAVDTATEADLVGLRASADALGVRLQSGSSGATVPRLRDQLRIAQALGCDLVRVVMHGPDVPDEDSAVAALAACAPDFEEAGIVLAIENHFLTPSRRMVEALHRIDSPAVGVTLDVANSIVCHEWPRETITALAPYARCVHLKDYRIEPGANGVGASILGTPLGEGATDIAGVLDAVAENSPHGNDDHLTVVLEQWSPWEGTHEATVATETHWRRRSAQAASADPRLAPREVVARG